MSEFQQVVRDGAGSLGRKFMRLLGIFLLFIALGAAAYVWVCGWTFSDGSRAGHLVKVTRKGVLFKTHEGQLNLGGFQTDEQGQVAGSTWNFSTTDPEVYDKLQNLEGRKVKLLYRERYKAMPWQGKTNYFVYEAEVVE